MRALPRGGAAAILTAYWLGCLTGAALGVGIGAALCLVTVAYLTREPVDIEWDKLPRALAGKGETA